MCRSLLLSQFLRLLKGEYCKSIKHVGFWIGGFVTELLPGIDQGPNMINIPEYFDTFVSLLFDARVEDIITTGGWRQVTNQILYYNKRKSFPTVKVERDEGASFNKRVWKFLWSPVLNTSTREISYMLVHNKLQVQERLFRIGLKNDPYCGSCTGAVVCDIEHFFCSCERVIEA